MPSRFLRLLALPCLCRTATQKPTPMYDDNAFGRHLSRDTIPNAQHDTKQAIYRCSILDIDSKTLREFQEVKNQRDKRSF
ncbi:MAG: hypothetical protein K2J03_04410 [Muribaculaceae bacterium]|nr:hypothetical protein [Muribaculaceae bacterium]